MLRLVTGYFVWDLAVWSTIFLFSAAALIYILGHRKKRNGMYVSVCKDDAEPLLYERGENPVSRFLNETLCWWIERRQAPLLLFAVLLLFFAIALLASQSGGGQI